MDTILFRYLILSDGLTSPQDWRVQYSAKVLHWQILYFINNIERKKKNFFLENKTEFKTLQKFYTDRYFLYK